MNPDVAKEYLQKEKKKPEYKKAQEEKNQAFMDQEKKPKETRENIEDLRTELSVAIDKYCNNGVLDYLQNFFHKHGTQTPIELEQPSRSKLKDIVSKGMSMVLQEKETKGYIQLLQLLKDVGAFSKEDIEESLEGSLKTLKLRDYFHGENNIPPEIIEAKVEDLRKTLANLFE